MVGNFAKLHESILVKYTKGEIIGHVLYTENKKKKKQKSLYSQNIRETGCAIKAENRWNYGKFVKEDWLYNKKEKNEFTEKSWY